MQVATSPVILCSCGADWASAGLRQCPEHFKIWNGSRRLTSVGRIIHATFPLDPNIPAEKLENARDRGAEVDALFAAYVRGELTKIPAGTRNDSRDLLLKLIGWFNRQNFKSVEVQVLLGDEDHGGVLDFRLDGVPTDLKCTYNVEHTARLQVAGYTALDHKTVGQILHVAERFDSPRMVPLKAQDYMDWFILLECWRMQQRRQA